MTNEPSPRPWTFCPTCGEQRPNSIIVDADGGNVALVCHFANEEEENRIGNLIVDAVNERAELEAAHMKFPDLRPVIIAAGQRDAAIAERDRLRDIVRRMAKIIGESPIDWYGANFVEKQVLLAEARAAIGEGEKK